MTRSLRLQRGSHEESDAPTAHWAGRAHPFPTAVCVPTINMKDVYASVLKLCYPDSKRLRMAECCGTCFALDHLILIQRDVLRMPQL